MSAENQSLMKLPNLNIESILLNLPLQSLFVCCCVSKSLLDLIKNDSHFAETHFAKSEPQLMIQSLIRTRCHLIDLDVDLTATERVQIKPTFNLPKPFFDITHSCNGLLLLERVYTDEDFHQCIVFNPVTGEYIIIPETVYPCLNVTCAFIYSPVTHRFGIFRVFHRVIPDLVDLSEPVIVELDPSSDSASDSDSGLDPDHDPDPDPNSGLGIDFNSDRSDMYIDSASDSDSDADTVYSVSDTFGEIYVSGSDSWESLGNVPFSPRALYSSCQLYNTTHWLCGDENVENVIVFFNFGTYRFGEIPAPAHISKGHARASDDVSLIVVENCLTIFDGYSTDDRFEVWKMREYGNVESWIRVCTIDTTLFSAYGILTRSFRPVLWRANGEVVMVCASGFIVYYDLLENEGRVVYHPPLFHPWSVAAHRPSFISLRNVVRGSNLEVLNVESRFVDDVITEFSYLELVETFSEMQIMID